MKFERRETVAEAKRVVHYVTAGGNRSVARLAHEGARMNSHLRRSEEMALQS